MFLTIIAEFHCHLVFCQSNVLSVEIAKEGKFACLYVVSDAAILILVVPAKHQQIGLPININSSLLLQKDCFFVVLSFPILVMWVDKVDVVVYFDIEATIVNDF